MYNYIKLKGSYGNCVSYVCPEIFELIEINQWQVILKIHDLVV